MGEGKKALTDGTEDMIPGSLRAQMHSREGADEAEFQIGRGMRAWAVERVSGWRRVEAVIVFGKSPSDAKRRAEAPARLGESCHGDVLNAAPIVTGWDEPPAWPLPRRAAA